MGLVLSGRYVGSLSGWYLPTREEISLSPPHPLFTMRNYVQEFEPLRFWEPPTALSRFLSAPIDREPLESYDLNAQLDGSKAMLAPKDVTAIAEGIFKIW